MAIKKGNSLANSIVGTSLADQLFGFGGNDTLTGSGGHDLLDGGTGTDRMSGGTGNDTYVVDRSTDRVIENAGQGTDTVKSSVTLKIGANVEHLILTGSKAINGTLSSSTGEIGNSLTGNGAANVLKGGLGHDVLSGGRGSDSLEGGSGNDTLLPGAGNGVADTINGGDGFDTVDYRDATTGVYVDLQSNAKGGAAAGDTFIGVESVIGSPFHDVLLASNVNSGGVPFAFGGAGSDYVFASTFDSDRIRGDDGFDMLVGDFGSEDHFWLQYDRGMDYLKGFKENGQQDRIVIVGSEFGLATAPNNAINAAEYSSGVFEGIPEFAGSQRLIYDADTRILWADKDGAGSAFDPVPVATFGNSSVSPARLDILVI